MFEPESVDPPPVPVFALLFNFESSLEGNCANPEAIIATNMTANNAAPKVMALTQIGEFFSQTGIHERVDRPDSPLLFVETETGMSTLDSTSCK